MLAELQQLDVKTCGVYTVVCELMFMKGGAIPDDDGLVMNYLHGCNVRTWHTSRDHLLGCGLFYREGSSTLRSPRVDRTIEQAMARLNRKTESLRKPLSNLRVGTSEIKDLSPEQVQAHIYIRRR